VKVALVALFGAAGALARYGIASAVGQRSFPIATLAINVVGSFLLGVLLASGASSTARTALGVGFLGAFTTFSTFAVEADGLDRTTAVTYVVLSVGLGIAAAALGRAIVGK
jgi:CrcB protein